MFLSVKEMEARKVRFDVTFPPGEIEFHDRKLRQITPLQVEGSAELMGVTQEIRVRGRLSVGMEADCDRCLEPAPFPLESEFDLFYRPSEETAGDEKLLDEDESEIGFYEEGGLDLKDIMREQILLSLPMQRICDEACKGICPVCGGNRNIAACGCHEKKLDDRWAALRELKQQKP